ncbi:XrtA/PEP-CTERM system-associated ATPase [Trichloromonas acetexigens]|uniref:AAA family ATPase n=1 Tax=Trichloromonas acetexigens TaxID=38815 RepID=A0A550JJF9_9BACT|nr:XrtA/PEP-CTERM system-associated ATPase [Desulfuromonas acetexigens]TRO83347.1 AAA family ATPase [Desulfuromonas acetexigens]
MYESYFGLTVKPFELVPNPRFLFNSRSHKKAISYLRYGLQERAGFILLTGEVGSGKTTIVRDLINNLDADMVLAMVYNTRATARQMLAMINEDFGLEVGGKDKDKVTLLRDLNDHLVALHAEQKRPVIIIDEAQNLSPAVLEEIRLLSNLEADNFKLVQIVLVGQPELQKLITRPELRQLRQRISVHCHLEPLTREETEAYVYHRLAMAGNRNALRWQEGTFDTLYGYSAGIPRLINVFCDFVLLAAFVEETHDISLEMLEEVIGDVSWDRQVEAARLHQALAGGGGAADEGISDRLYRFEQRLASLDAMHEEEGWIARRLAVHEELLERLADRQHEDAERHDAGLERILRQLDELQGAIGRLALQAQLAPSAAQPAPLAAKPLPVEPPPAPKAPSVPGPLPKRRWFGRR